MDNDCNSNNKMRTVRKASSLNDISFLPKSSPQLKHWRNDQGSSLLHIAAYFGRLSVVQELIQQGLDPKERNDLKWTSHHYLCRFHQPLNRKLSLGLQPKDPRSHSKMFKFSYVAAKATKEGNHGNKSST